jgi:hypothetical protein
LTFSVGDAATGNPIALEKIDLSALDTSQSMTLPLFDLSSVGGSSITITSQTWTPHYENGQIYYYDVVVNGTASGPIGSELSVDTVPAVSGTSWTPADDGDPVRGPGDPATTAWTVTDAFAFPDRVLTISLYNPVTMTVINVHAHL